MNPLTQSEFDQMLTELQTLTGAHLQELSSSASGVGLGLFQAGTITWLWFDLDPIRPLLLKLDRAPQKSKKMAPILLFLRAHARGRRLTAVRSGEQGRVGFLSFGQGDEACELEFRLFAHGQNLIARQEKSQISWSKPKELLASPRMEPPGATRSWAEISAEWQARQQKSLQQPVNPLKKLDQQLERKRKALVQVEKALEQTVPWAEIGEHLKVYGLTNMPEDWRRHLKQEQSVSQNIQYCFAKLKQSSQKLEGTQNRKSLLEQEIAHLEQLRDQPEELRQHFESQTQAPVRLKSDIKMRTFRSASGLVLLVGKSARDNLNLLREARSWDYWLHLRDFPGAHGIVRRERGQVIARPDLEELARALATQSLSTKTLANLGGKFDVLLCERRYVRALKGNQLGRVHYTHEQVLTVTIEKV